MKIDELLHIAGDMNLKSFAWGQGVVETLNNLFSEAQRITTEINGTQALEILKALPPPALNGILAIKIHPATGRSVDDPGPAPGDKKAPPKEGEKKHSPVLLVMAGVTTAIALGLTVVISMTSIKTGAAPDEGLIRTILATLVEIMKLFLDPVVIPPTV